MPPSTACPVPEIDKVLSPYINSKQDTTRIRKALSRYLSSNIKSSKPTLQHLDHECPHDYSTVNLNTSSLKASRLRYLHALDARLRAQARHQELQVSLEELQKQHFMDTPLQADLTYDNEATRAYISLLHQRRRFSELQVIQASMEKLLNINDSSNHRDPKTLVKETIGEQPDLPIERLDQLSNAEDIEIPMFKLKKAVLEAKTSMDRAKSAKAEAQAKPRKTPTLEQQVYALGCARDEIAAWVEGELGKMNEDSILTEDASPMKQWPSEPAVLDLATSEDSIRKSYNRYTTSRSNLIDAQTVLHATVPVVDSAATSPTEAHNMVRQTNTPKPTRTIPDIFPHVPCLAQIGRNERSLLLQTVYLQGQLSSADEELKESLTKLAEESQLILSGSTELAAWANTARQSETATKTFVKEQLAESRQEIDKVGEMFDLCLLQDKILAST